MINTSIPDYFSNNIIFHHFTFLWGPLPLMCSNWLSSGPYGKMYSTSVQCNAYTFYRLIVWVIKMPKPKSKCTWGRKSKEEENPLRLLWTVLLFTLTEFDKGISWKSLFKAWNRFIISEYLQILLDVQAHQSEVKDIL